MPRARSAGGARPPLAGRLRTGAAAALVLLTVAGCGPSRSPGSAAAPESTATGAPVAVDTASVEIVSASGPDILNIVRTSGRPISLVNVWATWCIPCREEFPDLLRIAAEHREQGLSLVLVSADWKEQVPEAKQFLAGHGVQFRTYLKTGDDMTFIDALSERWSGALPASFVYDRTGHLIDFWEGRLEFAEMDRRIQHALDVSRATLP